MANHPRAALLEEYLERAREYLVEGSGCYDTSITFFNAAIVQIDK